MHKVLQQLMGDSQSGGFSKANQIVNKSNCLDSLKSINCSFSDSGLWGVQFSGSSDQSQKMVDLIASELKNLIVKTTDQDLQRVKNILCLSVTQLLENQANKLEEVARSLN